MEVWKATLSALAASAGFPRPEEEFRFHPTRLWAFDLAWPSLKVAFEREGFGPAGGYGRHQRAFGMTADCLKYNAAQVMGWVVIRATPPMIESGTAFEDLLAALRGRAATSGGGA